MKQALHFAHANGFPASVYRKLTDALSADFDVGFIDQVGHNPDYPVTDCWPHLVDETLHYIQKRYDTPVVGVGHSLGGCLLFLAAVRRPELFRSLVILDSPLFAPLRSHGLWLTKKMGMIDRLSPGGDALRRRDGWESLDAVHDYFARKPLFQRWDPDCVRDYAQQGTVEAADGGRRLKFRPRVEQRIFRCLPHIFPRFKGRFKTPAAYVAGTGSNVIAAPDLRFLHRHYRMLIAHQRGDHLFPFQYPEETAQKIVELARQLEVGAS